MADSHTCEQEVQNVLIRSTAADSTIALGKWGWCNGVCNAHRSLPLVERFKLKRLCVPTVSFEDWKRLLAEPDRQWQPGKSAMSLAKCWEAAHPDFPPEVRNMLDSSGDPRLVRLRILVAMPEYQVELPGGSRASQTDLLVVARNERGLVVLAIEGKVDEDFGPTLQAKRKEASPGQSLRLEFLHKTLGLNESAPDSLRYQLFHRSASAILVAQEFHAEAAVMLVHSFSATSNHFEDFAAFASMLAGPVEQDRVVHARSVAQPNLFIGWCAGNNRFPGLSSRSDGGRSL